MYYKIQIHLNFLNLKYLLYKYNVGDTVEFTYYRDGLYHKTKVTCTTCGAVFETGSILEEIKVDTCANCHPFYTGTQNTNTRKGQVEKFNKKYGFKEEK